MYCVIEVPDFALQSVVRLEEGLSDQPVILVAEASPKAVVTQRNAAAREARITVGMAASQALARCPTVQVRSPSADAEKSVSKALFTCARSLSPRVEMTAVGCCTIDLAGAEMSGELYETTGGAIFRQLGSMGIRTRIGFSLTPQLAHYAARRARPVLEVREPRPFLDRLPLEAADPPRALGEILRKWGIQTVGAFVALPRPEVGSRLGAEGLLFWDRAAGRRRRLLRVANLPEKFEETLEMDHEIETLEPLLFILRRFLERLSRQLQVGHKVAEGIDLRLGLRDGSCYRRRFEIPHPTARVETLFGTLDTHLEQVRTESSIVGITLRIKAARRRPRQLGLFETALKNPAQFSASLARLVGVVGSQRLGTPRLQNSYRPDTFRMERLPERAAERSHADPAKRWWGLPLRRMRPPLPTLVDLCEGQPIHLSNRRLRGAIARREGPWRASGEWWEPDRWDRREWDVELESGGLYRLVYEGRRWFVEGMYD